MFAQHQLAPKYSLVIQTLSQGCAYQLRRAFNLQSLSANLKGYNYIVEGTRGTAWADRVILRKIDLVPITTKLIPIR